MRKGKNCPNLIAVRKKLKGGLVGKNGSRRGKSHSEFCPKELPMRAWKGAKRLLGRRSRKTRAEKKWRTHGGPEKGTRNCGKMEVGAVNKTR